MIFLGVDPSLTATGLALVGQGRVIRTGRIQTKNKGHERVDQILFGIHSWVIEGYEQGAGDVVVGIEDMALGAKGAAVAQIFGLWHTITQKLHEWEVPYRVVPIGTLKKYVTGNGSAGKDEMVAATVRRFPGLDIINNNEVDALGLARVVSRIHGEPVDGKMPVANSATLGKVRWGDRPADFLARHP